MATIKPPTNASGTARPGRPSEGFRIAPAARQTRPMLGVVAVLLILSVERRAHTCICRRAAARR
jgi:hypothetical protein